LCFFVARVKNLFIFEISITPKTKKMRFDQITFRVKFLPATNTNGARLSLVNLKTNERQILPFDYAIGNALEQASDYVEKTIPGANNIADFRDKDANYLVFELY
jgi:hypothetical protein